VSSKVNCPRCGKAFDVPDEVGKSWGKCPHCHAVNAQAVTVLDAAKPASPLSTAVSAKPPPAPVAGTSSGSMLCPRCGRTFDAPRDTERTWLSCPHCHEVNPEALVKRVRGGLNWRGVLGVFLLLFGLLGATIGSFLCFLGLALFRLMRSPYGDEYLLTAIWALGSVAIFAAGVRLLKAGEKPFGGNAWGPWGVFLISLLMGICAWIFVIGTCS
jgi:hypothetical protein